MDIKDLDHFVANAPHIFVLARGTPMQSLCLLEHADDSLAKALSFAALPHKADGKNKNMLEALEALKSADVNKLNKLAIKAKKSKAQGGKGFGDDVLNTLKQVGQTALQVLPTVAPLLISAL